MLHVAFFNPFNFETNIGMTASKSTQAEVYHHLLVGAATSSTHPELCAQGSYTLLKTIFSDK
jgi:hypothetical protein